MPKNSMKQAGKVINTFFPDVKKTAKKTSTTTKCKMASDRDAIMKEQAAAKKAGKQWSPKTSKFYQKNYPNLAK